MLKMFSAAVIAASLLAAPAMAAGLDHGVNSHTTVRHVHGKSGALNANARMMHRHHEMRHHHRHIRPHFRFHQKLGAAAFHKHSAVKATVVHKHG